MVKEFEGCDFLIKRIWVLELLVPCLVHYFHDEVLAERIFRFVGRMVISPRFMLSFGSVNFCSHRVSVNCIIVECDEWRDLICTLQVYMPVLFRWENDPGKVVC